MNNAPKTEEFERCIMCGKLTCIPVSMPTDWRENYEIGLGQVCAECAKKQREADERANALTNAQICRAVEQIKDMPPDAANTSGCRGIYYEPKFDRWRAQIIFQSKRYYLGTYKKKEDAIKARQRAEEELYGAFLDERAQTEQR